MKSPSEIREVRTLNLRIFTPTHIGTREGSLRAMEFVVHQGKVYLCNDDLLGQLLLDQGLFPRFMSAVEQGPVRLAAFLTDAGLNLAQVLPRISRPQEVIPGGSPEMQEFRPFIRDGQGNLFLPGSALKGVFRTALLYKLLQDPEWTQKVVTLVRQQTPCRGTGRERRRSSVFFSDDLLQRQGLQGFRLPGRDLSRDPTTDILRCLTVRDAYPLDPQAAKTAVVPIDFLSKGKDKGFYFSTKKDGNPLRLWVEALFPANFAVQLVWDQAVWAQFQKANRGRPLPLTGLDDLLAAVREMNQALIEHENAFYEFTRTPPARTLREALDAPTAGTADPAAQAAQKLKAWYDKLPPGFLRLGFGSGMLSTTMALRLPPELRQKVRDSCGSGPRPGEVAPKSRRVWRARDGQIFPLGWAKIVAP
jgi:CRISPR-associated protein Csm5